MNKGIIKLVSAAAFAFAMAPASAVVADGDWNCTWLTFTTATSGACFGSVNPPPNDGLSAINEIFGTSFDEASKDNTGGAGTTSTVFDAVGTGDGTTGTITFLTDVTDPFVLVLKLGQGWSAYQFDTDFLAGSTLSWSPTAEFNFDATTGLGLSHATIYSTDLCPNGDCGTGELPEPGSIALLGAGLAALSLTRRRRRA